MRIATGEEEDDVPDSAAGASADGKAVVANPSVIRE
jgi:hypothetical protein